jgi:hypothetical protein
MCSASCGGGSRTSSFVVSQPALYGGSDCGEVDGSVRSEACNEHPCPIDCVGENAHGVVCCGALGAMR